MMHNNKVVRRSHNIEGIWMTMSNTEFVRNYLNTTLNMISSVTYYLELCNAMIVYCASHLFTNHG